MDFAFFFSKFFKISVFCPEISSIFTFFYLKTSHKMKLTILDTLWTIETAKKRDQYVERRRRKFRNLPKWNNSDYRKSTV